MKLRIMLADYEEWGDGTVEPIVVEAREKKREYSDDETIRVVNMDAAEDVLNQWRRSALDQVNGWTWTGADGGEVVLVVYREYEMSFTEWQTVSGPSPFDPVNLWAIEDFPFALDIETIDEEETSG